MTETLTAQVTTPAGPVNTGSVVFDPAAQPDETVPVVNHIASLTLKLPANLACGTPYATANFNDGAGNYTASASGPKPIYLTAFNSMFPGTVEDLSNGVQIVTTDLFGIPLLFTYSSTGRVLSVYLDSIPLWIYGVNAPV